MDRITFFFAEQGRAGNRKMSQDGVGKGRARVKMCSAATFHSVSFSKPNPVWFGKVTPKNCVRFSKPIPVWFGKKKIDFARCRFQTKFRLVWKNH